MTDHLSVIDLGVMPYAEALELQRRAAAGVISGAIADELLLLVEHPAVITLGRSAKGPHLLAAAEVLAARGVDVLEVERGGDVTVHAPGQLVGYPIVDLKRHKQDLHWYLRQLEEVLIRALGPYGVSAVRNAGYTGVWVEDSGGAGQDGPDRPPARKIASIGVHARDWVTWHGFALNVTTDLSLFELIVPCGIPDVTMTSLAQELSRFDVAMQDVKRRVTERFGEVFGLDLVEGDIRSW